MRNNIAIQMNIFKRRKLREAKRQPKTARQIALRRRRELIERLAR